MQKLYKRRMREYSNPKHKRKKADEEKEKAII